MSDVYRTTRLAFLVKMLNHDVPQFRNMARESLRLDMVKRGVPLSENSDNFLGYDLNSNGFLNTTTRFGCQSDWPDSHSGASQTESQKKILNRTVSFKNSFIFYISFSVFV